MSRLLLGDINEFDDDDEFIMAHSGSKLKSLFGNDMTVDDSPLTFTAPVNPKLLKNISNNENKKLPVVPVNIKSSSNLILAKPVQAYKLENNTYNDLGKLNLAIIMNSQLKEYLLLLYLTREQILATVNIKFDFRIKILENNYINFIDNSNFNWSVLFRSNDERIIFLQKITIVKALISDELSGSLLQDLSAVASEGKSPDFGDNVEIEYSCWFLNGHEFCEPPFEKSNIRFRVGKETVGKIFEDSVLGMKVGCQRFVVCRHIHSHLNIKASNNDINRLIAIQIQLKKVKASKSKISSPKTQDVEVVKCDGGNLDDNMTNFNSSKPSNTHTNLINKGEDDNASLNINVIEICEENKLPNYPIKPDKSKLLERLAKFGSQMLAVPSDGERCKRSSDDSNDHAAIPQSEFTQKLVSQNNAEICPEKNINIDVVSHNANVLLTEQRLQYLEIKSELNQINNKLDLVHNTITKYQRINDLKIENKAIANLHEISTEDEYKKPALIKEDRIANFAYLSNENNLEEYKLAEKMDLRSEKYICSQENENKFKKESESEKEKVENKELLNKINVLSSQLNEIFSAKNVLSSKINILLDEKNTLSSELNILSSENKALSLEKNSHESKLNILSLESDQNKIAIEKLSKDNLNLQKELNEKKSESELLKSKLNLFRIKTCEMKEFYESKLTNFQNEDIIHKQIKSIMNMLYKEFIKHFISDQLYTGSCILEKAMEIIKQSTLKFIQNDDKIGTLTYQSLDQKNCKKLIESSAGITSNTNLNQFGDIYVLSDKEITSNNEYLNIKDANQGGVNIFTKNCEDNQDVSSSNLKSNRDIKDPNLPDHIGQNCKVKIATQSENTDYYEEITGQLLNNQKTIPLSFDQLINSNSQILQKSPQYKMDESNDSIDVCNINNDLNIQCSNSDIQKLDKNTNNATELVISEKRTDLTIFELGQSNGSLPCVDKLGHPDGVTPSIDELGHPDGSTFCFDELGHPDDSTSCINELGHSNSSTPCVNELGHPGDSTPRVDELGHPGDSTPCVDELGHPGDSTQRVDEWGHSDCSKHCVDELGHQDDLNKPLDLTPNDELGQPDCLKLST